MLTIVLGVVVLASAVLYFVPIGGQVYEEPKLEYKILTSTHIISGAYKVYGNPRLGFWVAKVVLANKGTVPVHNLKISYEVEGYSEWSESEQYLVLLPNSTIVDLYYPLLSHEVAKLTTPTPSRVRLKMVYTDSKGTPHEIIESKSIDILGVHDFIFTSLSPEENTGTFYDVFNNYPLLAAWVTPVDPVVREYGDMGNKLAGGAGATLSDEEAVKSLTGMWTLSVYNEISYKTEPEAFWTGKFSEYIKYPRDVIRDRAGTCVDTAIFFASLAIVQGLEAYIVLMPGHAFPLVKLPKSGQIIPIESTALNDRASFEGAVEAGVKTFGEAMSGPHIIVDIQQFQAMGIRPPELEALPADILQKWGIKTPTQPQPQPQPQPEPQPQPTSTYINPLPKWSMTYPSSWTVEEVENEVDFYSPEGIELIVAWGRGLSKEEVRQSVEDFLREKDDLEIVDEGEDVVSDVSAILVEYLWAEDYIVVARYLEHQGYGFAILYDFIYDEDNYEANLNACEAIVETFRLG